ncbi:MAG: hypothetical protein KGJ88_11390 [Verrucomicrobiota bacterium]|nr:hypothetical protein [Verrucomicrobiota bacterium]
MNSVLTVLLAYGLLAILYRFGIKPLFKSVIFERMDNCAKELENLIDGGALTKNDFAYAFLARRFNLRKHLATCNVSDFLHFVLSNKAPQNLRQGLERFQREASPQAIKCHDEFCKDFTAIP